jgi:non-ribosomal peptide synthetase-like protein
MPLHRREVVEADRSLTHEPPPLRYAVRLAWETLRFALPLLPWWTALAWLWLLAMLDGRIGAVWLFGLAAPLASCAAVALPVLATIALKWLLLGRVSPGQHGFWSGWCARWDFVYVAWQRWARGPLALLEGTLLQNAVLRLFGMSIGRRVVLGGGFAQVVDPDMLRFEDDATVACDFQAHTFEDRILKIDRLRIGRGATVGPGTVVFYGADIGDGAVVAPHGVVMKRAVLEAGERYEGQPVGPVGKFESTGAATG